MRAFSENRRNSEEFSVYGTNDKSSLGIVLLVFVHLCPRLFFHLWLYPAMYFFSLRGGGCQIFPRGCGSQLFQTLWGILRKHKFCLTGNRSDFLWKVWSWNRRGCENKGAWWCKQNKFRKWCLSVNIGRKFEVRCVYILFQFFHLSPYRLEWCLPRTLVKAGCLQVSSYLE